jgi:methylenetetrahydrofolate reductase (NADPH)
MPGEKIIDLVRKKEAAGEPWIAFEYYPPRTDEGVANLVARFDRMKLQEPMYADVTWGAGGTTSDLTLDLCTKLVRDHNMEANMHLTCTNMPEEKISEALEGAKKVGIRNIVALRGDAPAGQDDWKPVEGGFSCALDLIKHIRATYGDFFSISVAGYPEGHPTVIKKVEEGRELTESEKTRVVTLEDGDYVCSDEDYAKEMAYLKEKIDAGADMIITQMFFDVPLFFRFVKQCRDMGINCPIVPGIMLLQNAGGFSRMIKFCKTRVPKSITDRLEAVKDDAEKVRELGIELGADMCKELIAGGIKGLHLYTLNLEKVTLGILEKLGMKK